MLTVLLVESDADAGHIYADSALLYGSTQRCYGLSKVGGVKSRLRKQDD